MNRIDETLQLEYVDSYDGLLMYVYNALSTDNYAEHDYYLNIERVDYETYDVYFTRGEERISEELFASVSGFSVDEIKQYVNNIQKDFENMDLEDIAELFKLDYSALVDEANEVEYLRWHSNPLEI